MGLEEKDIEAVKLARPVALVDLWEMDDRLDHLEEITERLEKAVRSLVTLYHEERVKTWEVILREMLNQRDRKNERKNKGN